MQANPSLIENIIETGIPKLDEIFGGGIRKGSSVLLISTPGLDQQIFLLQIMYHNLKKRKKCLYFVDDKFPSSFKEKLKEIKLWEKKYFDESILIDGFSTKIGVPSKEKYVIKKYDAENISSVIEKAIKENENDLILFLENYENLILNFGADKALALLDDIISSALSLHATTVFSLVNWDFSESFIAEVMKRFDYVVKISNIEEKFLMKNYFYVEKSPTKFSKIIIPYRYGMDGVGIYVPKILVTGPFHSGKSSFIQKISTRAVSIDRMGTTIALDHGYIDYGGISADLFGTPGQERFEFMLDILKQDAFGIILIVDSTDPSTFERGMEMLRYIRREAIPYVVAANKQDIEGALPPEEIRKMMKLPEEVPIIGTSAVTGRGCIEAVKTLIDLVILRKKMES